MAGRKSKYTPEKAAEIVKLLSGGATIKDTCAYVGITDDTLSNWCKRDSEFSESVNKARATGKIECAALVRQAARSNWQAAAWFLERSDPEHWGRRDAMKITLEYGLTPDQINRIARILAEAGEASPGDTLEALAQTYVATPADTGSS